MCQKCNTTTDSYRRRPIPPIYDMNNFHNSCRGSNGPSWGTLLTTVGVFGVLGVAIASQNKKTENTTATTQNENVAPASNAPVVDTTNSQQETSTTLPETTPEEFLENMFKDSEYESLYTTDKVFQKQILKKYDDIYKKDPNLDANIAKMRLINFTKGYEFYKFQSDSEKNISQAVTTNTPLDTSVLRGYELDDSSKENFGKDITNLTNAYITYFDDDGDNQIKLGEMLKRELEQYYKAKNVPEDEIDQKVESTLEAFRKNYDKNSEEYENFLKQYGDESSLYSKLLNKFNFLEKGEKPTANDIVNLTGSEVVDYIKYLANTGKDGSFGTISAIDAAQFEAGVIVKNHDEAEKIKYDTLRRLKEW